MAELPEIKKVEMQDLDRWFTTLVDDTNYNLEKIQEAVTGLKTSKDLTNIDTPPIQYLKNSLDSLVNSLNSSFSQLKNELDSMDGRLKSLEASGKGA